MCEPLYLGVKPLTLLYKPLCIRIYIIIHTYLYILSLLNINLNLCFNHDLVYLGIPLTATENWKNKRKNWVMFNDSLLLRNRNEELLNVPFFFYEHLL